MGAGTERVFAVTNFSVSGKLSVARSTAPGQLITCVLSLSAGLRALANSNQSST